MITYRHVKSMHRVSPIIWQLVRISMCLSWDVMSFRFIELMFRLVCFTAVFLVYTMIYNRPTIEY